MISTIPGTILGGPIYWYEGECDAIYTSNPIERMNKEIRKRLKPMNSLTNMDTAEKIVYLDAIVYNDRFADRVFEGLETLQ